jgi:hypothetical protein
MVTQLLMVTACTAVPLACRRGAACQARWSFNAGKRLPWLQMPWPWGMVPAGPRAA